MYAYWLTNSLSLPLLHVCNLGPKFIMSAKKFVNKRTSYYLISVLNEPEERGGDDIVGKVTFFCGIA
jgi:hypothetical protein